MSPKEFVCAIAHSAAAELLRLSVPAPDAETIGAAVVVGHVRIVVSLVRDAGPMTLDAETLAKIKAHGSPQLTPLQRSIVEMLGTDRPTKLNVIWVRLGRKGSPSGSFRAVVADLVRFGVITHVPRQGYMRAA